jgi:cyclopropane fatty-acyl-phospholipid synthase-like methyltransferase
MIAQLRSLLAHPPIYRFFGTLIGGPHRNAVLVEEYIRPKVGDRVLDIGCGPGTIIPYLPRVEYVGVDASREYVDAARAAFSDRATFICERVSTYRLTKIAYFDIVLAVGVLHHLGDEEALRLFRIAHAALRPGGRLVTLDGCIAKDQPRVARYLVSMDRGQHIRTREALERIASQVFSGIRVNIRHDLLRIPYTLSILECTRCA